MLKYDGYQIVFQEVPDEISLAFNITGCPFGCIGCHSPELQEDVGVPIDDDILSIIQEHKDEITCVLFLGGDYDPEGIANIIIKVRTFVPSLKIALYCGGDHPADVLYRICDYIKVGHYDESRGGLSNKTTNQIMYKVEHKLKNITKRFQRGEQG